MSSIQEWCTQCVGKHPECKICGSIVERHKSKGYKPTLCDNCREVERTIEQYLESPKAREKIQHIINEKEYRFMNYSYKNAVIIPAGKNKDDKLLSWEDYICTIRRYAIELAKRNCNPPFYILCSNIVLTEAQIYYEKNDVSVYEHFKGKKYIKDWLGSLPINLRDEEGYCIGLVASHHIQTIWTNRSITFTGNPQIIISNKLTINNNIKE